MLVYAIIAPALDQRLDDAVAKEFDGAFYKIAPGQFFVSSNKLTTREISEKLGAPGGNVGRVLIMPVNNYTGWHAKDMWEWLGAQDKIPSPMPQTAPKPADE